MSLLVVSDLHIEDENDPLYPALLELLGSRAKNGDRVVLAGDLFDLFVGNKDVFLSRYEGFVEAVRSAASRGISVHYIEGNHDFLLSKAFGGLPGLAVHPREVKLELEGKRFFVAHGDTADRSDWGYRVLRFLFRSPLMKGIVAVLPGRWIEAIGRGASRASRGRKPCLAADLPPQRREMLRKAYRSFAADRAAEGFDFVVLGHCHDLDEMVFRVGPREAQYINMGYPRVHGSFLSWEPGDPRIHRESLPRRPSGN